MKNITIVVDNDSLISMSISKEAKLYAQAQTYTPYHHQTSKGSGMKRSAQESSFLCPKEFVGGGSWSSCYRLAPLQGNWYEARSYCNSLGAELLSMETLKEAYIIDYLIKSYGGGWMQLERSCPFEIHQWEPFCLW